MSQEQGKYTTKGKTIFRTIKNEDHPFVMIDRRPVENPELSWGAKGVLSYLLSRPDNWTVRLRDLVNRSTDGVYKIRGYLKELEKAGHLSRKAERDPITKRIIQYTLEVYELPFATKPLTNLPQAGLPQAENLTLNDIDLKENEVKKEQIAFFEKAGIEWSIFAGQDITEEHVKTIQLRDIAPKMFEKALQFSKPLPWWDGDKEWRKLGEWVCAEYEKSKTSFGEYNIWRNTKYTKGGITNSRLRGFPQDFYDSWDMFLMATQPQHKTDESPGEYQRPPERIRNPRPDWVKPPRIGVQK